MSQPPDEPRNSNENGEHHSNINDESRATLDADVEPSNAVDIAHEERLDILIKGDTSHPED